MLPGSCYRVVIACLVLTWMLGGTAARAVQIRPAPPNLIASAEVFEGQTATIPLQLFNDGDFSIFLPAPTRIVNAIDFDGGDRNDEAYDTRIANDKCPLAVGLAPGQGCLFDLEVLTRDLNPMPPPNNGDWKVRVGAVFEFIDPTTGMFDTDFIALTGIFVRVHDPDPLPVPEPGNMTMWTLVACIAVALLIGRRGSTSTKV